MRLVSRSAVAYRYPGESADREDADEMLTRQRWAAWGKVHGCTSAEAFLRI